MNIEEQKSVTWDEKKLLLNNSSTYCSLKFVANDVERTYDVMSLSVRTLDKQLTYNTIMLFNFLLILLLQWTDNGLIIIKAIVYITDIS
jgi:hypothetical protein